MQLAIATYNLKDFFAPPLVSEAHFAERVVLLSKRILASGATLVALQEVGAGVALESLRASLGPNWVAVPGTPDERGIQNAIVTCEPLGHQELYMSEVLPFPVFVQGDPAPFGRRIGLRRAIVRADITHATYGTVTLLSMHLKSNLPRALSLPGGGEVPRLSGHARAEALVRSSIIRSAEALFARGIVDTLLGASPEAKICVAGDMNDDARSLALRVLRGDGDSMLATAMDHVKEHKRFTTLHRGKPGQLDHLLLAPALARSIADADVLNGDLYDHGPFNPAAPPTVDSDHALHVVRFV